MALATKFFDEVGKYKKGVHYHVCTLQAFLAAALGGHTMHHLAGINPFHHKEWMMMTQVCLKNPFKHVTSLHGGFS